MPPVFWVPCPVLGTVKTALLLVLCKRSLDPTTWFLGLPRSEPRPRPYLLGPLICHRPGCGPRGIYRYSQAEGYQLWALAPSPLPPTPCS